VNFRHTVFVDLIVRIRMQLLFDPHTSHATVLMLHPSIFIVCMLTLPSVALILACIHPACQSRGGRYLLLLDSISISHSLFCFSTSMFPNGLVLIW
jgi:hypothetical protein